MAQTVFTFISPLGQQETQAALRGAVESIKDGKVKKETPGYLLCQWRQAGMMLAMTKFEFYVGKGGVVRCVTPVAYNLGQLMLTPDWIDNTWAKFLTPLLVQNPDADFGVSDEQPTINAVMYADGEVQQVINARTRNNPAYGKALAGGLLFGAAGAIVGGMGGSSVTRMTTRSVLAKQVYIRLHMTNGRVREGSTKTNSKVYNEIMVSMN